MGVTVINQCLMIYNDFTRSVEGLQRKKFGGIVHPRIRLVDEVS